MSTDSDVMEIDAPSQNSKVEGDEMSNDSSVSSVNSKTKRTPAKRLSAAEKFKKESEEILQTLGHKVDENEDGGRRRTRSSGRGLTAPVATPPPAKRERKDRTPASANTKSSAKGGRRGRQSKSDEVEVIEQDEDGKDRTKSDDPEVIEEGDKKEADSKDSGKSDESKPIVENGEPAAVAGKSPAKQAAAAVSDEKASSDEDIKDVTPEAVESKAAVKVKDEPSAGEKKIEEICGKTAEIASATLLGSAAPAAVETAEKPPQSEVAKSIDIEAGRLENNLPPKPAPIEPAADIKAEEKKTPAPQTTPAVAPVSASNETPVTKTEPITATKVPSSGLTAGGESDSGPREVRIDGND